MKRHFMKLSTMPFLLIKNGEKTIESRLCDEKRQQIRIGDEIEFRENDNMTNTMLVKVVDLYYFNSFSELFLKFPPHDFGGESVEQLSKEILTFYTEADEKKFGVVGIRVKKS